MRCSSAMNGCVKKKCNRGSVALGATRMYDVTQHDQSDVVTNRLNTEFHQPRFSRCQTDWTRPPGNWLNHGLNPTVGNVLRQGMSVPPVKPNRKPLEGRLPPWLQVVVGEWQSSGRDWTPRCAPRSGRLQRQGDHPASYHQQAFTSCRSDKPHSKSTCSHHRKEKCHTLSDDQRQPLLYSTFQTLASFQKPKCRNAAVEMSPPLSGDSCQRIETAGNDRAK